MFVFGNFGDHVKIWPRKEVDTDNVIFRLHYRFTFLFILVCVVIISSREFVKEHISCLADDSVAAVINSFCFFSATFTVSKYHNSSYNVGTHIVAPGVGPHVPGDNVKRHAYYQWVPFVLFAQALMFYLPHAIWKTLEKGRLSTIVNMIKTLPMSSESDVTIKGHNIDSEETKRKKEELFKEFYVTSARFKINKDWTKYLVLCEILNALNVILQMYIVDLFLKGQFMNLGVRWLEGDETVLDSVFPKMTKCTFYKYGQSGSIQQHDTLCVMALNIINEKVYTILWFWFIILLWLSVLGLVWRLLEYLLHRRSSSFNKLIWSEVSPGPALSLHEIHAIANKLSFSDWLFLYYLGKNMDGKVFRKTVKELVSTFSSFQISEKSSLTDEPC